jgi:16S rRNA G1207 methylase RsmC
VQAAAADGKRLVETAAQLLVPGGHLLLVVHAAPGDEARNGDTGRLEAEALLRAQGFEPIETVHAAGSLLLLARRAHPQAGPDAASGASGAASGAAGQATG